MLALYEQVRQMNSMGVLHLNRQNYTTATQVFHQALAELLRRLHVPSTQESFDTNDKTSEYGIESQRRDESDMETETACDFHTSDRVADTAILRSVEISPKNTSLFATDAFLVFNRGLLLNANEHDVGNCDSSAFHAASVALTYNVGLAHHLHGIEKGDLTLMSRALDFYLLAYVSLVDKSAEERNRSSSLILGLLALANNIGHIHATLCDYNRTKICSEEILLRLAQILDSQPGPSLHLSEDEYKIFLLNACFFREFMHACAPAA